jgi:phytoene synthase
MNNYDKLSQKITKQIMHGYSTSFSRSTRLFPLTIRRHIYNIYALVRVADEIVDTYKGTDAKIMLDELVHDVYRVITGVYSTNPVVHAFGITARTYDINDELIAPFFASMRMDLIDQTYTEKKYKIYIYGSAEVVGLMCLKVYCPDTSDYEAVKAGAMRLGSAYQKINFLRDLAADTSELHRMYFPGYTLETFDETAKRTVVADIHKDLSDAQLSIEKLPGSVRRATQLSVRYYKALLQKLEATPVSIIKNKRIRINDGHKLWLSLQNIVGNL